MKLYLGTKLVNIYMDNKNIDLHHARIEAGFESSKASEAAERLEYYGKVLPNSVVDPQIDYPKNDEEIYGKIANPTVHAALNQLRKVVNELLELYGRPEQIVIELAFSGVQFASFFPIVCSTIYFTM